MSSKGDRVIVFITAGTEQEGDSIARLLVERRKVACINMIPRVRSLFWWQDKIDSTEESLLIAKTMASLVPDIVSLVREVHSYEVPEIIAMPVTGGNEGYLKWVADETKVG